MSIINEPGLYSLVLGSRKPQAKAFTGIPAFLSHTGFHPVNDLRLNFLFSVCSLFVVPVAVYRCTYCTKEFKHQQRTYVLGACEAIRPSLILCAGKLSCRGRAAVSASERVQKRPYQGGIIMTNNVINRSIRTITDGAFE